MRRSPRSSMEERILVLPDRRIRRCRDRDDVPASEFGWKLAGNLRQLLGYDIVGSDRSQRFEAGGTGNKFYRFEDVSWFHHPDVSTAVPLFGSQSQKHASLMEQYKPSGLSLPTFKRMLTGTAPSRVVDGWQRRSPPDVTRGHAPLSVKWVVAARTGRRDAACRCLLNAHY